MKRRCESQGAVRGASLESQEESQGLWLGQSFTPEQAEPFRHIARAGEALHGFCCHDTPLIWCPDVERPPL